MFDTKQWLFAPTGLPVRSVQLYGFPIRSIDDLTNDGLRVENWSTEELYESIESWETPTDQFVYADDHMFLTRHCRPVTVDIDFDESDGADENCIEPWADDIVAACERAATLEDCLRTLVLYERGLPKDIRDNPISRPAMDNLIVKPLRQDITMLEARITAYRATRTEPTSLGIEEPEDAEA